MKKTLRRLRLDRETVRNLTPGSLESVAGGLRTEESCWASCPNETIWPPAACPSARPLGTQCC